MGMTACLSPPEPPPPAPALRDDPRDAVVQAMLALQGADTLSIGGREYTFDCSGSILAAHHLAGLDLSPTFEQQTGNGVRRLWDMGTPVEDHRIRPGDVVFWDNTWDRNGSRRLDDELTHAGIVVATDIDGAGTMEILHHHYRDGLVSARMNLYHRDNQELNSPMRMRSQRYRQEDPWLDAQLFRGARTLR